MYANPLTAWRVLKAVLPEYQSHLETEHDNPVVIRYKKTVTQLYRRLGRQRQTSGQYLWNQKFRTLEKLLRPYRHLPGVRANALGSLLEGQLEIDPSGYQTWEFFLTHAASIKAGCPCRWAEILNTLSQISYKSSSQAPCFFSEGEDSCEFPKEAWLRQDPDNESLIRRGHNEKTGFELAGLD